MELLMESNHNHSYRKWLSWVLMGLSSLMTVLAFAYALDARIENGKQEGRTVLFRSLIATTDHGLVVLDPSGHIIEWGPGAEQIFGWQSSEVIGSLPTFLMPEKYREMHARGMVKERYDMSRQLVDAECWAYKKDGTLIPVHIVASSFRNHIGYYHVALFTLLDNTKLIKIGDKPQDAAPPPKPFKDEHQ